MARETSGGSLRYLGPLFELAVTSGLPDGQLLERFAAGAGSAAELAFATLGERHGPMVLRACPGILRDEHAAMDAFQATFLVLIRKSRWLWVRDSLGPWLHRVACRAAIRLKRESARRRRLERRSAELRTPCAAACDRDELAMMVHEEIDRLPEHYRVAVVTCDVEGRTCEEAARLMRCPVGTVASRLARGRGRLRQRLVRRGVGPGAAALGAALAAKAVAGTIPAALAQTTFKLAVQFAASRPAIGASSAAAVSLAEDVSRNLLMAKAQSLAAALAATGCAALLAVAAIQASDRPGRPPGLVPLAQKVQAVGAPDRKERPFLFDFREARNDHHMSIVGNMRPLLHDENGVRFQTRVAVLTKQGTVTLWNPDAKDPVVPPLRHAGPIREVGFLSQAHLLITTSETSVKVWNALTGELRKEIEGEVMRPLLLTAIDTCAEGGSDLIRFATIDTSGRFVTTWDAATLKQVGTFRPEGTAKLVGAGVTRNGKTLATIGDDRSVTLWVVGENKPVATLHPPSPVVARCFVDDQRWWEQQPTLQLDDRFWEIVAPLMPLPTGKKP